MKFTIVLPIYGHSPWLKEAIESVLNQERADWKLLIADDGADKSTKCWLKTELGRLQDQRIVWNQRSKNLGLFANLNQAMVDTDSEWVVILCSDDKLKQDAIKLLHELQATWSQADLIISSFESINSDGSNRPADSSRHHDQLRKESGLVEPRQMIPAMLRLGSLNGNLTGMAFSKKLWRTVGPFREDWRHAADWEWLIRASERNSLLLNRQPIAAVRTHEGQLSVKNRVSGHEITEVAAVVEGLLKHEMLIKMPERKAWGGHIMQFQLWNLIKAARQGDWSQWHTGLQAIHKSAGLRQTCKSLLGWLPSRWKTRTSKKSK